ncbi:aminoglycoside phosphotransferase [Carbonactinospora thermoautotrophica]|uniref:Maltokinase n=1 Tax=Carbonactinospora thermoautotrophica TaxID=1469144 RepID=A0A132NFG3_9ACTN|nr:aminoglycoside phosphotransferase [Carbonactinospora thermoautotrophica]KWX08697.1 aminoglycoside phosphotransferase [Carbonactinospora thermoautotrophica]
MHGLAGLDERLRDWLPGQRWFGGKGREIRDVELVSVTPLVGGDPAMYHLVAAVHQDGFTDRYQLLLGVRRYLPHRLLHCGIGEIEAGHAYDAAHDSEMTRWVLERLHEGATVGPLRFHRLENADFRTDLASLVMGVEQSNTSMVFGDQLILKMFRKLMPGVNPDLELTLALAAAGSPHVADPYAWYEMTVGGETTTLGMLQRFLHTATDGWELAITSVRDLYAEADLHPDEVGGDFAPEAFRLGMATAEVHHDLAATLPTATVGGVELAALAEAMTHRLRQAAEAVPELAPYAPALQTAFTDLAALEQPVPVQRIHGDYHLGQVLRTPTGWVLTDFEGEPTRPLAERRALHSPIKDVAGMLRSFDYAARHLLADHAGQPEQEQLEYRAVEWAERNRTAFCDGYAEAAGSDPREQAVLLRAFETDKVVYEVMYEARNRPSWLPIPLSAAQRLAG